MIKWQISLQITNYYFQMAQKALGQNSLCVGWFSCFFFFFCKWLEFAILSSSSSQHRTVTNIFKVHNCFTQFLMKRTWMWGKWTFPGTDSHAYWGGLSAPLLSSRRAYFPRPLCGMSSRKTDFYIQKTISEYMTSKWPPTQVIQTFWNTWWFSFSINFSNLFCTFGIRIL